MGGKGSRQTTTTTMMRCGVRVAGVGPWIERERQEGRTHNNQSGIHVEKGGVKKEEQEEARDGVASGGERMSINVLMKQHKLFKHLSWNLYFAYAESPLLLLLSSQWQSTNSEEKSV